MTHNTSRRIRFLDAPVSRPASIRRFKQLDAGSLELVGGEFSKVLSRAWLVASHAKFAAVKSPDLTVGTTAKSIPMQLEQLWDEIAVKLEAMELTVGAFEDFISKLDADFQPAGSGIKRTGAQKTGDIATARNQFVTNPFRDSTRVRNMQKAADEFWSKNKAS